MLRLFYRRRRRIVLGFAALPLLQVTGCPDLTASVIQLGGNLATSLAQQVIFSTAGAALQVLLQSFPGSNILRALLGGNAGFFP